MLLLMSQSFIISATVFIIVMVVFHIIKDIFLSTYIDSTMRTRVNRRWLISTAIGLIVLYMFYGCSKEYKDPCLNKGPTNLSVICNKIYQPVRAPDGTVYSNSCMAEADGWDNQCLILVLDL